MTIKFRWYRSGKLFGIRYEMEQGDALPVHSHEDETLHNVIVVAGTVALVLPDSEITATAGNVVDFDGTARHTVRCESRHATILNMFLNGIPDGYDTLPETEHQGTL